MAAPIIYYSFSTKNIDKKHGREKMHLEVQPSVTTSPLDKGERFE
jgi:hypothetical protein